MALTKSEGIAKASMNKCVSWRNNTRNQVIYP